MRLRAGIVVLAAAAVFAGPAQAQVSVPVGSLPEGTPGCTTTSPAPSGQGQVTTCTWGPATCEESFNHLVVAGPSHSDGCRLVLGPAEADCSSEDASHGFTHFETFSDEQCGASVGNTEVRHSCHYESSGGGGFFDEDTQCLLVIGDFRCETDPDDDGTEADEIVGCVSGGPDPECRTVDDMEPPDFESSMICTVGPLTCGESTTSEDITRDYHRGCALDGGDVQADCGETRHEGPTSVGGYGYSSGTGCTASAGQSGAEAGCETTDTVPPDGSETVHTEMCTIEAGDVACTIDRADPPASIVDSAGRCVTGEE